LASSAPPSPFETAPGFFPNDLTSATEVPEDPLVEFASPSEPDRVSAALAPVSSRPLARPRRPVEPGNRLSWVSCSLEHCLRRMPLLRPTVASRPQQGGWRSPNPHRCRPQGSCPSRRFWPCTRHARTPCGARRSPWHPDASRPCSMPLAPLESPFRAFPSRGAVPALAGLLLPCGFAFDRPTARHGPRCSRPLSPARRPLAAAGPKARRTGRLGRRFPGVARRRSWRVTALGCGVSSRIGRARRTRRPARPLRSFAPLESPFSLVIAALARVRSSGRCSPGLLSPLERSPADSWVRSSRGRTWSGRTRASCALESSPPGHAFSPGLSSGRGV